MNDWKRYYISWQYEALMRGLVISTRRLYRYLDLIGNAVDELGDYQFKPLSSEEVDYFGISDEELKLIDFIKDHESEYDKYHFPEMFYESFVMSTYSSIEIGLLDLCEFYLELKLVISPTDTNFLGNGIVRAYKFLDQAIGYRIDNSLWQELQSIRRVRNQLIHSEAKFIAPVQKPKNGNSVKIHIESGALVQDYYLPINAEYYKYVSKLKILEYSHASTDPDHQFAVLYIKPTYDYCRYLIDFQKNLFVKVYSDLLEMANQ